MLYSLTTLGLRPNTLGAVMPRLQDAVAQSLRHGRFLGCFTCEFGVLNRISVLASYADAKSVGEEHAGLLAQNNPFGLAEWLGGFEQGVYMPLAFAKPIEPGKYGPFYEIRTYCIAAGGLEATSNAWSKVVERRNTMSRLLMVMASLNQEPQRMVHIWPYPSIDERTKARAQAAKEGIWPPPGGSDHLLSLQSELFVATGFSPLA